MSITQLDNGKWRADIEPVKGKRFRKSFKTKSEAQRFEATCRAKIVETPEWEPKPKDRRRLTELISRYDLLHGHTLAYAAGIKRTLHTMAKDLGNPVGSKLSANMYCEFRSKLLESGIQGKTLNTRLGYMKAAFNELIRLGEIEFPNPLGNVRPLRLQERPVSFLNSQQIEELLTALDDRESPQLALIARVCLTTGARWGEAQALVPERVRNKSVTFANTKSKKTRTIPITARLEKDLNACFRQYGAFTNCMLTFGRELEKTSIKLPKGQSTHVLRHTFASHFVMKGGNILTLQKILGHGSLAMTMRYAHLAPDHLQDALRLNPLASD